MKGQANGIVSEMLIGSGGYRAAATCEASQQCYRLGGGGWEPGAYRDQIGCENRHAKANLHKRIFEDCWSLPPKLFDVVLTGVHGSSGEVVGMGWGYWLRRLLDS